MSSIKKSWWVRSGKWLTLNTLKNLILACVYGSYVYFLSAMLLIIFLYGMSEPSSLISHSIEGFHLAHNKFLETITPPTYIIFFGFMYEVIIRLSAVKSEWNLEKWEHKILPSHYKEWATRIGISFSLLVVIVFFKLIKF